MFLLTELHLLIYTQLTFTVNVTTGPWWRPLPPQPVECSISLDIVPPGPVPVESIELLQDLPLSIEIINASRRVLDDFSLSWSPPPDPYGEIQQYFVSIGSSLQEGTDTFGFQAATVSLFVLNTKSICNNMLCFHVLSYVEWQ